MRLIDADELIKQTEQIYCTGCNNYNKVKCRACPTGDMLDDLDNAPTVDQWHYPSKGEYPTEDERVLVAFKEHRIQAGCFPPTVKMGRLKWNGKFFEFSDSDYFKDEILGWMPIPEPPKEVQNGFDR